MFRAQGAAGAVISVLVRMSVAQGGMGPPGTPTGPERDGPPPLGQLVQIVAANFSMCVIGGCPTSEEYDSGPGYEQFADEIKHQFGVNGTERVPTTPDKALKRFPGGRDALRELGCDDLTQDFGCRTEGSVCTLPCGQENVSATGEHLFEGNATVLTCTRVSTRNDQNTRLEYTGDVKLCLRFTADAYDLESNPNFNNNNRNQVGEDVSRCNCVQPVGTQSTLYFCEPVDLRLLDSPPVCTRLGHDGSCPSIGCNYTYCRPNGALGRDNSAGSFWNFTIPSEMGDPIYSLPATQGPLRYLRIQRGIIGSAIMMDDSGRCNFLDPNQDYRLDSYADEISAGYAETALDAGGAGDYVANASFQFFDLLDVTRSSPIEFTLQLGMNTELKIGAFVPGGNNVLQLRKGVRLGGNMSSPDHSYNDLAAYARLEAQGCDVSHIKARDRAPMPGMDHGCSAMPWLVSCITTGTSPYRVTGQNLPPGIAIDRTSGEFLENSMPIQTGNWTSYFIVTDFNLNQARTEPLFFVVVDDQLTVTAADWNPTFAATERGRAWRTSAVVNRSASGGQLPIPDGIPVQDSTGPNTQGELDINALDVSGVELVICYPPSEPRRLDCVENTQGCILFSAVTSADSTGSSGARINNEYYNHTAEVQGAGATTVVIKAYDTHLKDFTDIGNLSVTGEAQNTGASNSDSRSGSSTMIVGIVVGGFMLLFAASGGWYLRYKRRQDRASAYSATFFNLPKTDEWEYPRAQLVMSGKLGEGEFGVVMKATATDIRGTVGPTLVAVKECLGEASVEDKINFVGESQLMKRLDHPNVLRLLGVCMQEEPLLLIAEFMELGDLKEYMRGRQTVEVSKLLSMGIDVANGLGYLNAAHRFIHRDLACRNCLLDGRFRVKIGDFGMSRAALYKDYYRLNHQAKLPVRWMSPESLIRGSFSSASDVWSLGVVLWELFSFCEMPYPGKGNNEVFEEVRNGYQMARPPLCPETVYAVCLQCWEMLPDRRPSAYEVAMSLHEIFLKVPGADVATRTEDFHAAHNAGDYTGIVSASSATASATSSATKLDDHMYESSDPKHIYVVEGATTKDLKFYSSSWRGSSAESDHIEPASSTHRATPAGSSAPAAGGYSTVAYGGGYSTVAYDDDATAS